MSEVGDWRDLGVVTPGLSQWTRFPLPMAGGVAAKIKFEGLNGYNLYFVTFIVIRPVYGLPTGDIAGEGKRFYPKTEQPEILADFPIPQDMLNRGDVTRAFEVKKFLKWRNRPVRSGEPLYRVRLFDFTYDDLGCAGPREGEYFADGTFVSGGQQQGGGEY